MFTEIGQAFEESLEDGDQPKKTEAKPAEAETPEPEEAEESTDEAESEESEAEAEPEEEPQKAGTKIKLSDGSEHTLEEIEKGFLRQQDYTRKTQEISSNRKQLEEAAQRFVNQDRQVKEFAEFAKKVVESYAPKPPDAAMINTDPVGYLQQKEAFDRARADLAADRGDPTEHRPTTGGVGRVKDPRAATCRDESPSGTSSCPSHSGGLESLQGRSD